MHKGIHTPTMQDHVKTGSMSKGKQTSMRKQGGSKRGIVHTPTQNMKKSGGGKRMSY